MKNSQCKFDILQKFMSYSHTDLACEAPEESRAAEGAVFKELTLGSYEASELTVSTKEAERACGCPIGRYATLHCPDMSTPDTLCRPELSAAVSDLLRSFISSEGFDPEGRSNVLIAGLGNRFITPDSIGARCADKVIATSHLNRSGSAFASLGIPSVSVIAPGVSAQTGIEAADIIKGAAASAGAQLIIAIDALAARSTKRLCATVQISNSGIRPGSGIGNHRSAITRETMGIPVIAVGVPTVISCATLVYDSLCRSGAEDISPALENILRESEGFFVSHGESDTICECAADILASAIGSIFTYKLYQQ